MARYITQDELDALLARKAREGDGEVTSGPATPDDGADPSVPPRSWLASALQEAPGEWSIRRIVFALSFLFGCGLCLAALLRGGDIGPGVKDLATTIIVAAFAAVGIGRFAEAMDSKKGGGE